LLPLAEAAMCTAITQSPVMAADWKEPDVICVGVLRPAAGS
jgi:hypothetical protein